MIKEITYMGATAVVGIACLALLALYMAKDATRGTKLG